MPEPTDPLIGIGIAGLMSYSKDGRSSPTDRGKQLLGLYEEYEDLAISRENPYDRTELRLKVLGLILCTAVERCEEVGPGRADVAGKAST